MSLHQMLDDPTRTAPHGAFRREAALRFPALTDAQILDRLHDLFSGADAAAFGKDREWWADIVTDGGHDALCLLALPALSSAPAPTAARRAQAELRQALIGSARALLVKAFNEGREVI
ncbi:hypothetical protein [Achromobacter ruhlandii]|nr:hypothetical protein [Achromobacter ruhlandii]